MTARRSNTRTLGITLATASLGLLAAGLHAEPVPSLKDAYKNHFRIGTAINRAVATGQSGRRSEEALQADIALVISQFDHVVAENEMKWESVHPRPGADGYDWRAADAFVEFGLKHGMDLVGHTLVWHSQTPNWVFDGTHQPTAPPPNPAPPTPDASAVPSPPPGPPGARRGPGAANAGFRPQPFNLDGPRATREELLERMRTHIQAVMGRYKGKVKIWDVVNEAIADDGPNVLRRSPWSVIIGDDFVEKAFEFAHQADPEAILRYNDYGLENPEKRRKCLTLIRQLREKGVPVMAIGSQAHLNVSITFDAMDQCLAELKSLDLPVHITELDVNGAQRGQRSTGADVAGNAAATEGGLVAEAEQRLTTAYTHVFRAFLKHRDAIKLVTFWGPNDANSWRSRGQPLLFDAHSQPKPAFHAVIALAGEARSQAGRGSRCCWGAVTRHRSFALGSRPDASVYRVPHRPPRAVATPPQ